MSNISKTMSNLVAPTLTVAEICNKEKRTKKKQREKQATKQGQEGNIRSIPSLYGDT